MPVEAKIASPSKNKQEDSKTTKSSKRPGDCSLPFIIYNYQEQLKTKSVSKIRLAASKVCVTDKLVKNIIMKSESREELYLANLSSGSNLEGEMDDMEVITQTLIYKSKLEREIKAQMLRRAEMQRAMKALSISK